MTSDPGRPPVHGRGSRAAARGRGRRGAARGQILQAAGLRPRGAARGRALRAAGRPAARRRRRLVLLAAAAVVLVVAVAAILIAGRPARRSGLFVPGHAYGIAIGNGGRTAYVISYASRSRHGSLVFRNSVVPVSLASGRAGHPVRIGSGAGPAVSISLLPGGRALVTNGTGTVLLVSLRTGRPGPAVRGFAPYNSAEPVPVAPDGSAAYLTSFSFGILTPLNLRTGRPGRPVRIGAHPIAAALAPGGKTVYVLAARTSGPAVLVPVSLSGGSSGGGSGGGSSGGGSSGGGSSGGNASGGRAGPPISLGPGAAAGWDLAIAPDGATAYVVGRGSAGPGANRCQYCAFITPVNLRTGTAGTPVSFGSAGQARYYHLAIAPDGATLYVASGGPADTITPVDLRTRAPGEPVHLGSAPTALAVTPDGRRVYVAEQDGSIAVVRAPSGSAR